MLTKEAYFVRILPASLTMTMMRRLDRFSVHFCERAFILFGSIAKRGLFCWALFRIIADGNDVERAFYLVRLYFEKKKKSDNC